MSNVHVVIVTYGDRLNLIEATLAHLLDQPAITTIHIVSNNADYTLPQHSKIDPILLDTNTGSATGYKIGIERAAAQSPDFIWLLDDDNRPSRDGLDHLLTQYSELQATSPSHSQHIALTASRQGRNIVSGHHQPDSSFLGFRLSDLPAKMIRRKREKPISIENPVEITELAHCPYGGLFFKPALLDLIGLPDESFVLYADDIDFTGRIPERGGKLYLVPQATIDDLSDSWNIASQDKSNLTLWLTTPGDMRAFYSARNLAFLEERQAGNSVSFRANRFAYVLLLAAYAIAFRKLPRLRILLAAFKDARKGHLGLNHHYPLG